MVPMKWERERVGFSLSLSQEERGTPSSFFLSSDRARDWNQLIFGPLGGITHSLRSFLFPQSRDTHFDRTTFLSLRSWVRCRDKKERERAVKENGRRVIWLRSEKASSSLRHRNNCCSSCAFKLPFRKASKRSISAMLISSCSLNSHLCPWESERAHAHIFPYFHRCADYESPGSLQYGAGRPVF